MKRLFLFLTLLIILYVTLPGQPTQWDLLTAEGTTTITFDESTPGVIQGVYDAEFLVSFDNDGLFDGAMNSDVIRFYGCGEPTSFGDFVTSPNCYTSGLCATTGVTSCIADPVDGEPINGTQVLLIIPDPSTFNAGAMIMRAHNATGEPISAVIVTMDLYYRNTGNEGRNVSAGVSVDDATYTPAYTFTTPEAPEINSQWIHVEVSFPVVFTSPIPDDEAMFLQIETQQDPSFGLSSDRIAVDNISLEVNNVLPVGLSYFTASEIYGTGVRLDWGTSTETENEGFDIQRAGRSQMFETIGFIAGNGTSTEPHTYSFIDRTAGYGPRYYRLVQRDFDGTSKTHKVAYIFSNWEVSPNDKRKLHVFPNPVSTSLSVKVEPDAKGYAIVMDGLGKTVKSRQITANHQSITFDVSDLPTGMYNVQLRTDLRTVVNKRFLKR